jgi:hypothetical protein
MPEAVDFDLFSDFLRAFKEYTWNCNHFRTDDGDTGTITNHLMIRWDVIPGESLN